MRINKIAMVPFGMVTVILYGDLKRRSGTDKLEIGIDEKPLIEILKQISERLGISNLIFREGKVRGELLILVDGADWNSLGLLDKPVKNDSTIKLIPIWHGG